MSYENPPVPHEVNVGRENPVLEFLRLAAGLAVVLVVLSVFFYFAGGSLARRIPYSTERAWVGERVLGINALDTGKAGNPQIDAYLQDLTQRIAAQMDLPSGMETQVHFVGSEIPNAFASLGGHIAVTRGLYERMPSENALALVLAHEIAHLRARDPIASLGGSAALVVMVALVTGNANSMGGAFAGVVQRGYSRRAEAQADEAAIEALKRLYGHAGGGAAVFEVLSKYRAEHGVELPSLLSTHPLDAERIERMRQAAAGWNPVSQPLQALPQ